MRINISCYHPCNIIFHLKKSTTSALQKTTVSGWDWSYSCWFNWHWNLRKKRENDHENSSKGTRCHRWSSQASTDPDGFRMTSRGQLGEAGEPQHQIRILVSGALPGTFKNFTGRLFRERVRLRGELYLHGRGLRWRLLWWLLRNRSEIERSLYSRHIWKYGYFRFWGTKSWRPIARVSWRSVLLRSLL